MTLPLRELRSTLPLRELRLDRLVFLEPEDPLADDFRLDPFCERADLPDRDDLADPEDLPDLEDLADLEEDRFELADFPEREGPADVVSSDGPQRRPKAATNTSIFRLKIVIFLLLVFLLGGESGNVWFQWGNTRSKSKGRAKPWSAASRWVVHRQQFPTGTERNSPNTSSFSSETAWAAA